MTTERPGGAPSRTRGTGFDAFVPRHTVVERMHPVTKILAVFCLGLSAMFWPNPWLGLALVVALFAMSFLARMPREFAKIMFGFGIPISVMLLFIQGCYSPRNTTFIADLGFAKLGLEGILYATKLVVTLLVFLGSFYLMNKTTYTGRLVAALTASGLPAKMGYLVLASLNVVPQMHRRMSVIQEAQSARGLQTSGGLIARVKAYLPLMGPVVMSSLTDAQERGMTLETRGFGIRGVKRTSYVEVHYTASDRAANWSLLAFFIVVLIVSTFMRLGVLPAWGGN